MYSSNYTNFSSSSFSNLPPPTPISIDRKWSCIHPTSSLVPRNPIRSMDYSPSDSFSSLNRVPLPSQITHQFPTSSRFDPRVLPPKLTQPHITANSGPHSLSFSNNQFFLESPFNHSHSNTPKLNRPLRCSFDDFMNSVEQDLFSTTSPRRSLWTTAEQTFTSLQYLSQMGRIHDIAVPTLKVPLQTTNSSNPIQVPFRSPINHSTETINSLTHSATVIAKPGDARSHNPSRPTIKSVKLQIANGCIDALHGLQKTLAHIGLSEMDISPNERAEIMTSLTRSQSNSKAAFNKVMMEAFSTPPQKGLNYTLKDHFMSTLNNPDFIYPVRDALIGFGGSKMLDYSFYGPSTQRQAPQIRPLGDPTNGTLHFTCGINNTLDTVLETQNTLYTNQDGKFAIQAYQAHDFSMVHGLSLVACQKMGINRTTADCILPILTPPILDMVDKVIFPDRWLQANVGRQLQEVANRADEILKLNNPLRKQVHITFSNGVSVMEEILKNLSPAQRNTVILIPVGPTKIVDEKLAFKVYPLFGDKDWPSHACNGGLKNVMKMCEAGKAKMVFQKETQPLISGHYILQPEYQVDIKGTIIKEIQPNYEIH